MKKKKTPRRHPNYKRSSKERKLVLQAKQANAFKRKIENSLGKLEEMAVLPAFHAGEWKEKTGRYYSERVRIMIDSAPKALERYCVQWRKRLQALPW